MKRFMSCNLIANNAPVIVNLNQVVKVNEHPEGGSIVMLSDASTVSVSTPINVFAEADRG